MNFWAATSTLNAKDGPINTLALLYSFVQANGREVLLMLVFLQRKGLTDGRVSRLSNYSKSQS
jgi:hypothetical protein